MCQFNKLWIGVRLLKSSSPTWFTTKDNLKGYDYINGNNEISIPFYAADFTEFWFVRTLTSGGIRWMRVLKENAIPGTPSADFSASTISSYDSSASKTFRWDLGTEDYAPIIGNVNTYNGVSSYDPKAEVLYFQGS